MSSTHLLKDTTTLGKTRNQKPFVLCLEQYGVALLEAGVAAATAKSTKIGGGYLSVLRNLKLISPELKLPSSVEQLEKLSMQMLLADWGRRPYKEYWFHNQSDDEEGHPVPREVAVRRQIRLGALRRFREAATDLRVPHWPALAFPTRPMRLDEIGLVAPGVLLDDSLL